MKQRGYSDPLPWYDPYGERALTCNNQPLPLMPAESGGCDCEGDRSMIMWFLTLKIVMVISWQNKLHQITKKVWFTVHDIFHLMFTSKWTLTVLSTAQGHLRRITLSNRQMHISILLICKPCWIINLQNQSLHNYKTKHMHANINTNLWRVSPSILPLCKKA